MFQERDFEFEDGDVVKTVKRAASEVPLMSRDEDLFGNLTCFLPVCVAGKRLRVRRQ